MSQYGLKSCFSFFYYNLLHRIKILQNWMRQMKSTQAHVQQQRMQVIVLKEELNWKLEVAIFNRFRICFCRVHFLLSLLFKGN